MPLLREPGVAVCRDGWRLGLDVVFAAGPRAVAIAGHAMMVDRRTLDVGGDGLVSHLARRGIAVVWPDLRGHGRSGPLAAAGGRWHYDDIVEQDTPALVAFARARFPGLPLATVGHSLFGHTALAYAARHPDSPAPSEMRIDRLVLLAANTWAPRFEPDPRLRIVKRLALAALVAAARPLGYLPVRALRLGSCDEVLPLLEQFERNYRGDDWLARDGFSYRAAAARLAQPVLALAGAGDRLLCAPAAARRYVAAIPHAEVAVVGRASGLPFDPGHMALVLDRRCRPVWDRIATFVLAAAADS